MNLCPSVGDVVKHLVSKKELGAFPITKIEKGIAYYEGWHVPILDLCRVGDIWLEMTPLVVDDSTLFNSPLAQLLEDDQTFVNLRKAVKICGVSSDTVHNWMRRGYLRVEKRGRYIFYNVGCLKQLKEWYFDPVLKGLFSILAKDRMEKFK